MEEMHQSNPCMSEKTKELFVALLKAEEDFEKTGLNGQMTGLGKWKYAKLPDIYDAVKPALSKNGIKICHFCKVLPDGSEVLRTRLVHAISEQWIEDERILMSEKPGNQAKGSANTYNRKSAVLSLCAIAAEEDDDCQQEEQYIREKPENNTPYITAEQVEILKNTIRNNPRRNVAWELIKKTYNITKFSELKSEYFNSVKEACTV